jgi:hypothetical protein
LWINSLGTKPGHEYLYQQENVVSSFIMLDDNEQEKIYSTIVHALSKEFNDAFREASRPNMFGVFTRRAVAYYANLEKEDRPYVISDGWNRYLKRLVELLFIFYEASKSKPKPLTKAIAQHLLVPFTNFRGCVPRGPSFFVELPANTYLAEYLSKVGFEVPDNQQTMFMNGKDGDTDGNNSNCIFFVENDYTWKMLVTGAVKTKDSFASQLLLHYQNDCEHDVRCYAQKLWNEFE